MLDDLVRTKPEQREHGVVGLEDLAPQIADEDRIWSVLDQALRVCASLVQLAHVAKNPDDANGLPAAVAQRRSVQCGRNHFARRAAGVEADVSRHPLLDDLAHRGDELVGLPLAQEAGQRLLEHLVAAEAEQLRDRLVRLQDLPVQVAHEDRIGRIGDNDVRRKAALNISRREPVCAYHGHLPLHR